eukprot:1089939-Rhodomonas_salina.2
MVSSDVQRLTVWCISSSTPAVCPVRDRGLVRLGSASKRTCLPKADPLRNKRLEDACSSWWSATSRVMQELSRLDRSRISHASSDPTDPVSPNSTKFVAWGLWVTTLWVCLSSGPAWPVHSQSARANDWLACRQV